MNVARNYIMAFFATALGFTLYIAIFWWREWLVALIAVLVLDAAWRLHLHKRSIRQINND